MELGGALAPTGADARRIAELFWWMTAFGLVSWLAVLAVFARALGPPAARPLVVERWVVGLGGVAIPVVLLTVLLVGGLPVLGPTLAWSEGPVRIAVTGHQYWWRVRYDGPDGSVALANELVLPVGRRIPVVLASADVIHSLWIPSLAGKMDLIPGRTTVLPLEPLRTGVFPGVCAEYCGTSHANMALPAVVVSEDAFADWLAHQAAPAADLPGEDLFLAKGCGACHTVRGTLADGLVGPDLTHVGSRQRVGAGRLPNDRDGFRAWLADTDHVKPGVLMPHFETLSADELDRLAAWLDGLQ